MAKRATAVADKTPQLTPDVAEMWKRLRSGRREGHYYVLLFGLVHHDPTSVIKEVERGLRYASFERFQKNTALSQQLLAHIAEIPDRTLARRKAEGRFDPEESDRLLRIARIFARAIELFEGDIDAARDWLTNPQRAIGGNSPLEFARTDAGSLEVNNLIGRLEHGVPV